jgi:uncharacterized phage infection (PIP) family protein YhgE
MSDNPTQRILDVLIRLEAGQTSLQAGQASLQAGQASLEAGQASLQAGQASLEAGQASLEAGQTSLGAAQVSLGTAQTSLRVDLMARMDRLQDGLTAIRDDIGVNIGAVEAGRRANDNTRDDLRTLGEQVSVMWKQLKRLQTDVREIRGDP